MTAHLNNIECPQCGFWVDDRAPACPECGRKAYVETPADITPSKHPPIDLPPPAPGVLRDTRPTS